jgi:hypothetical protein
MHVKEQRTSQTPKSAFIHAQQSVVGMIRTPEPKTEQNEWIDLPCTVSLAAISPWFNLSTTLRRTRDHERKISQAKNHKEALEKLRVHKEDSFFVLYWQ